MKRDADVLIVGAGPTGLMLGNQLARRGVRVRIVDRHSGPSLETRALGVQARTLEIEAHLGIADRALELGKRGTGVNLWVGGRRSARVPLGDIGRDLSPYPFLLILGQDDTERLLGESLQRFGVAVEWNTELVGITQEANRTIVRLKRADGTSEETAIPWVAGCDGAHSAVRELNGIPFPGAPYEHVFFVADVQMTGPMTPDELNVYLWRDGFHLFFPMRGTDHWRIVGIVPAPLRGKDDLKFEEVVPSIRGEAGFGLSFQGCTWFSTYKIHHRRAARFRDRRCFLLGDAAHIHSPVGAQGMNTGIQDAYNLGWKLASVVADGANAALLDTYEEERIPVARRLLRTTDRAFSLVVSDSPLAGILRNRILARMLAFAMRFRRVQTLAFRTVSQIAIAYRGSRLSRDLSGLPRGAPRAGDRFPWLRLRLEIVADGAAEDLFERIDDTRFALILFGQPSSAESVPTWGDRLRTLVIPEGPDNLRELVRAKVPSPSFYLLRPDGHVGLCGIRFEPEVMARYLSDSMGLTRVTPGASAV